MGAVLVPVGSMVLMLLLLFAMAMFALTALLRCKYRYLFGSASDILSTGGFNYCIQTVVILFQVPPSVSCHAFDSRPSVPDTTATATATATPHCISVPRVLA